MSDLGSRANCSAKRKPKKRIHSYSIWEALRHRDVILLTLCYFCAMTGSYGIAFWLPTILKRLSGKSDLQVTLLAALPYIAAFITQQLNGWHSDRTGERRWHAALPVFLCGVALALAVVYRANPTVSILLFIVAGGAFYGFQPCFWAVPTLFLSESAAGRFDRIDQLSRQSWRVRRTAGDGLSGQPHAFLRGGSVVSGGEPFRVRTTDAGGGSRSPAGGARSCGSRTMR